MTVSRNNTLFMDMVTLFFTFHSHSPENWKELNTEIRFWSPTILVIRSILIAMVGNLFLKILLICLVFIKPHTTNVTYEKYSFWHEVSQRCIRENNCDENQLFRVTPEEGALSHRASSLVHVSYF